MTWDDCMYGWWAEKVDMSGHHNIYHIQFHVLEISWGFLFLRILFCCNNKHFSVSLVKFLPSIFFYLIREPQQCKLPRKMFSYKGRESEMDGIMIFINISFFQQDIGDDWPDWPSTQSCLFTDIFLHSVCLSELSISLHCRLLCNGQAVTVEESLVVS